MPFYEKDCESLLIKNYDKLLFSDNFKNINDIEIFFICVGTPLNKNGNLETNEIINVCQSIKNNIAHEKEIIICIRSTILPGTCEKIDNIISNNNIIVATNPEFLSQGTAINDFFNASRIVIGADNIKAQEKLSDLYKGSMKIIGNIPLIIMKRKDSEMAKFMANSYLAMRISFINEISNLCEKLNINIDNVIDGVKFDKRIGADYFKYGIGYGGSCLPKDTQAISNFSKEIGMPLKLIDATIEINKLQLLKCLNKILCDREDISMCKIAMLGVTFKAQTDDIRNSSSIYLTDELLKRNAKINVYDPRGLSSFRKIFKNKINYYTNIDSCIKKCNIILILTDWDEIKNYDFGNITSSKKIYIYDFKACLKQKNSFESKIKYWTIGGNNNE